MTDKMTFKIDIADWLDKPLDEIKNHIKELDKCRLSELKFIDLLVSPDGQKGMRHGVYAFFDNADKCQYVGKCSSSHFAQRLGMHFGMSPSYGGNFLGRVVKKLYSKSTHADYVKAVGEIGGYRYLMILVDPKSELYSGDNHKTKVVGKLEKIFMALLEPELNKFGNFNVKSFREKLRKSPTNSLRDWIEKLAPKSKSV